MDAINERMKGLTIHKDNLPSLKLLMLNETLISHKLAQEGVGALQESGASHLKGMDAIRCECVDDEPPPLPP